MAGSGVPAPDLPGRTVVGHRAGAMSDRRLHRPGHYTMFARWSGAGVVLSPEPIKKTALRQAPALICTDLAGHRVECSAAANPAARCSRILDNDNSGEQRMIAYVTLGSNDLARAGKFYDALLGEIGAGRAMENERLIMWASGEGQPMVGVITPIDEKTATAGNGTMVALGAANPAAVDKLYAKAIELGATDEGAPGPRGDGAFYIGYFRDLDGNKLNFFCMNQ